MVKKQEPVQVNAILKGTQGANTNNSRSNNNNTRSHTKNTNEENQLLELILKKLQKLDKLDKIENDLALTMDRVEHMERRLDGTSNSNNHNNNKRKDEEAEPCYNCNKRGHASEVRRLRFSCF